MPRIDDFSTSGEASLGDFLKGIFPVRRWPVFRDTANAKGFLHRACLMTADLFGYCSTYDGA